MSTCTMPHMAPVKADSAQQALWSRITGGKPASPSHHSPRSTIDDISQIQSPTSFQLATPRNNDELIIEKSVPRFAGAQKGRTIHHPRLQQPTPDQEKVHLSMLDETRRSREAVNNPTLNNSDEEDLVKKLSKALLLGSHSTKDLLSNTDSYNDVIKYPEEEKMPSPTSTLCFPESHNDSSYNNYGMPSFEPPSSDDDYFIGTCQFIESDYDNSQQQFQDLQAINKHERLDQVQPDLNTCQPITNSTETCNSPWNCCGGLEPHFPSHTFVICADTQLGVTSQNEEWETELDYSRQAIRLINSLDPRPLFVCVCGDLTDMEYSFEESKGYSSRFKSKEECDNVQDDQNRDFQRIWSEIHPSIALVCLCGNHDVGNRPTPSSIQRYKNFYGDEYLGFWANGTYNIVLNNVLFANPTGAPQLFERQLEWLEQRLKYAHEHDAKMVFVFGHHPWFLYHEDEDEEDLKGLSPFPAEWTDPSKSNDSNQPPGFRDAYFAVPKKYRTMALDLFRKYGVNAAFTGHFHQNVVSKSSWGMDHIITSSLSVIFDSSGKPTQEEANVRGVRLVEVHLNSAASSHSIHNKTFIGTKDIRLDDAVTLTSNGKVRNGGTFSHLFLPIGC